MYPIEWCFPDQPRADSVLFGDRSRFFRRSSGLGGEILSDAVALGP